MTIAGMVAFTLKTIVAAFVVWLVVSAVLILVSLGLMKAGGVL